MDASKAMEFLHMLGCRKVSHGGNWVRSTCPLEHRHAGGHDNKPSFAISIRPRDSSGCRCLGCGYATEILHQLLWKLEIERGKDVGRASAFLLKHNQIGVDWLEANAERKPDKNDLMGRVSHSRTYVSSFERHSNFVHPDDEPQPEVPAEVLAQMVADMPPKVREYLKREPDKINGIEGRALDDLTISEWELGWHRLKGRICIPIRDETGKLVSVSGRKFDENAWGPKYLHSPFKRDRVLFGSHRLNKEIRKGYLTEGFFQTIRLAQLGYPNPLGRMGSHLSKQQANLLAEWFDHLVIVPDGDKAGYESAEIARRMLEDRIDRIDVAEMPKGKDADSLKPAALRSILDLL